MDEDERIAVLRAALATDAAEVELGIGDDAAVLRVGRGAVLSVDSCVEGVHFERRFAPLDRIGRRAIHAAASDLAAMGALPRGALVALAMPASVSDDDFLALVRGVRTAMDQLALPIVGGNLSRASEISLHTTVVGEAARPLTRAGAKAGEGVYLTGPVGRAALGLRRLLAGEGEDAGRAWLDVRARLDCVPSLSATASAAIDVSDGLARDLSRLLGASGVGATLDAPSLVDEAFVREAANAGANALELALHGGEDYEVCFTSSHADAATFAVRIGTVEVAPGLRLREGDAVRDVPPSGHDHFARG